MAQVAMNHNVVPLDEPLVRRAQQGDRVAFEALYRRHAARIHALALRMSGSQARAEELTQEVFVRAWRRLPSFRHDSQFGTWLRRLATHGIIDELRKHQRRDKGREVRTEAPRTTPHARVDLDRAICTLPDKARQVFVLHDVEGFKHTEIAQMMGITPGTARGQLHRARALLREALDR
jgi:RNA polymerase sigma-70 factor (ECF subfamily)